MEIQARALPQLWAQILNRSFMTVNALTTVSESGVLHRPARKRCTAFGSAAVAGGFLGTTLCVHLRASLVALTCMHSVCKLAIKRGCA